jgi:NAD(P)-dependent dehydrogenase (short-subunit alcohol dehydrogenase family)
MLMLEGRHIAVLGGSSGIGAAAAAIARRELGAQVTILDRAQPATDDTFIDVDLRDRASIDRAVDQLHRPLDALLACAGVGPGTADIGKVNFAGQRHLFDRLRAAGLMPRGSALAIVSSTAGIGWEWHRDLLGELLGTDGFEAAVAWMAAHPELEGYRLSKMAMSAYVAHQSFTYLQSGIRLNAIQPGPTDTPLLRANPKSWPKFGGDYREALDLSPASAEDQAYPLLFLCTDAARHIAGVNLLVDAGYIAAGQTGTFPAPLIAGRMQGAW